MLDGEYRNGDVVVKIEGLNRVVRDLRKSGADMNDMKDLMHSIGMIVVNAARPPVLTGKLGDSIRAGRGKTKAVVRAGYSYTRGSYQPGRAKRAVYGRIIHYGWADRGITGRPFLSQAERQVQGQIFQALDQGMEDIFKKNDL